MYKPYLGRNANEPDFSRAEAEAAIAVSAIQIQYLNLVSHSALKPKLDSTFPSASTSNSTSGFSIFINLLSQPSYV